MKNKTIDVLKLDLAGGEWDFIKNLDIEYACIHVKQIIVETQPFGRQDSFDILRKIQKCFSLFYRKSRFRKNEKYVPFGNHKLNVNTRNSLYNMQRVIEKETQENLISYLFLYGELYFANINFLLEK